MDIRMQMALIFPDSVVVYIGIGMYFEVAYYPTLLHADNRPRGQLDMPVQRALPAEYCKKRSLQ